MINYDLPWNPMRLVQRHGRIDRIGSSHDKVFMHCFFPDANLDDLLRLEERLMWKIKQAAAAVGVESEPLPGSKAQEVVFAHTRDEIEALAREEADLFETGGEVTAYSGEEYRQGASARDGESDVQGVRAYLVVGLRKRYGEGWPGAGVRVLCPRRRLPVAPVQVRGYRVGRSGIGLSSARRR